MSVPEWIERAAERINESLSEIEGEAMQRAQAEQNPAAADDVACDRIAAIIAAEVVPWLCEMLNEIPVTQYDYLAVKATAEALGVEWTGILFRPKETTP